MQKENLLTKLDKKQEDLIDNITHGKNEDIFVRNARRKEFEKKYNNRHLAAWMPGWYAYVNIKEDIKNPEWTKTEKAISCGFTIVHEIILDAARLGAIYGLYKWIDYLHDKL